jgi:hypothetical protein
VLPVAVLPDAVAEAVQVLLRNLAWIARVGNEVADFEGDNV